MEAQDAKWDATKYGGRRPGEFRLFLRSMKVGDCKRILHPEVKCGKLADGNRSCSYSTTIAKLRRKDPSEFECYHESDGVLVIRRVE